MWCMHANVCDTGMRARVSIGQSIMMSVVRVANIVKQSTRYKEVVYAQRIVIVERGRPNER